MNYSMEFTELLLKVMSLHYTNVVPVPKAWNTQATARWRN